MLKIRSLQELEHELNALSREERAEQEKWKKLELKAKYKLEERERELERVLTRSFNPENGFYVDFLVSKVRDNGRHGFYIEAAPYNPITEDFIREQGELTARTNEFLTSLSRVIKEFLRKNVHRR